MGLYTSLPGVVSTAAGVPHKSACDELKECYSDRIRGLGRAQVQGLSTGVELYRRPTRVVLDNPVFHLKPYQAPHTPIARVKTSVVNSRLEYA